MNDIIEKKIIKIISKNFFGDIKKIKYHVKDNETKVDLLLTIKDHNISAFNDARSSITPTTEGEYEFSLDLTENDFKNNQFTFSFETNENASLSFVIFRVVKFKKRNVMSVVNHKGKSFIFEVDNINDSIQGGSHSKGKFYEELFLGSILKYIPNNSAILDIGANIGNHAIYLSSFTTGCEVFVFEPNHKSIDLLKRNVANNNIDNINFSFLGRCIGSGDKYTLNSTPQNNLGGTSFKPDEDGIESLVIDDIVFERKVGFIKVDVEGMEFEVLSGCKDTILKDNPTLLIEVTDETKDRIIQELNNINYRIIDIFRMYHSIYNIVAVGC